MRTEGSGGGTLSNENERLEEVSGWAHPTVFVIGLVITIAMCIAISQGLNPQQIQTSLLVGLAIGLPYVVFAKWEIRKNADFHAEAFTRPIGWRLRQWKHWFSVIPALIAVYGLLTISLVTKMKIGPGLGIMVVLTALIYPEQRMIWQKANEKLAEITKQNSAADKD